MRNRSLFFVSATLAISSLFISGCSSKLSRRQAQHQIDAMLKPHPVGSKKVMSPGSVPGFGLPAADENPTAGESFELAEHKEYGPLTSLANDATKTPESEEFILEALSKLGYITVTEEGPKTVIFGGARLSYSHSRTVRLTSKVGTAKATGYSEDYATGFSCYPEPSPSQCSLPSLVEVGKDYEITGIVQDETHAKVNVLISWKLTSFGLALQPFAKTIQADEDKRTGISDYYTYAALYPWEHFLNTHAATGSSPAAILFQKFDDGWRIVDENGKSEKDFN